MVQMNESPIEKLLEATEGRFILASVAAVRAKEINAGAKILATRVEGKPHTVAFREVAEGKVRFQLAPEKA